MPATLGILQSGGTVTEVSATNGLPVNIVGGGGSGGTAAADNATFTEGTSTLTPVGGEFNTAPGAPTSGRVSVVRVSTGRAFMVNLRNDAGTEIGTVANPVQTAFGGSLPAGTNTIGAVTGPAAAALALDSSLTTISGKLPAALVGGRLDVNIGASANLTIGTLPAIPTGANVIGAVTQSAGPWTVSGTVTANAGTGTFTAAGDVAHGSADSGNPVKRGGVAIAHGTNPTAVAAAQRTNLYANRAGVPFVIGGHPNVQTIAQNYTGAQTDAALITVGAGTKIVVTGFLFTAHNANSVNVAVRIGFGTTTTPAYGSAQLIGTHPGVAAGSGFGRGGGAGIIGIGADNEDLRITMGVPTGGSADLMVSYYTIES